MGQTEKRRGANGRWKVGFIDEVVKYAKKHSNALAIRKYGISSSTFYGWLRRPRYRQ